MPAIKCLSEQARDFLVEVLEELEVAEETIDTLKKMATCPTDVIEYADDAPPPATHTAEHKERTTPRKKREPSAYQRHTGECMKGGKHSMSECAAAWRAKKGK
jgi:hypothetical protein|tara:strand:- start:475 stop:783 length:309 start_codon:yes stop_codon:yes gene_type:complete